jgi:phage shock protein PspC (stress-responsive transcriptional regulator)
MSATDTTPVAPLKELRRSREDRVLAGVAGGLGRYFDLSPTFFRVGFAILTLIGGTGILLYVAAALIIPNEGETESIASEALKRHRERPWLLFGLALVAIAMLSIVAQADFWPNSGFAWILLLLGALAIVIAQRRSDRSSAPPVEGDQRYDAVERRAATSRPSLFLPVFGGLVALGGLLALLSMLGVEVRWDVALAVAAVGTGVAVVVGSLLRRRTGGLVLIGLALATLAIAVSAVDIRIEGPVGTRTYAPVASTDLSRSYGVAVGELQLDLTETTFRDGETSIDANVGVGELLIIAPPDAGIALDVDATASAGDVTVLGRHDEGVDADVRLVAGEASAERVLRIDAHVGLGDLTIRRGQP